MTLKYVTSVEQIKEEIESLVPIEKGSGYVKEIAERLQYYTPYQVCVELYDFMGTLNHEGNIGTADVTVLLMPSNIKKTSKADVKSLCLLFGAVLKRLNIPFVFRLQSFPDYPHRYMHLVVETEKGEVYLHTDPAAAFDERFGFEYFPHYLCPDRPSQKQNVSE